MFQMPSRSSSIVLTLQTDYIDDNDVAKIAMDWINKQCHISWPHLLEALIIAVTTEKDV